MCIDHVHSLGHKLIVFYEFPKFFRNFPPKWGKKLAYYSLILPTWKFCLFLHCKFCVGSFSQKDLARITIICEQIDKEIPWSLGKSVTLLKLCYHRTVAKYIRCVLANLESRPAIMNNKCLFLVFQCVFWFVGFRSSLATSSTPSASSTTLTGFRATQLS